MHSDKLKKEIRHENKTFFFLSLSPKFISSNARHDSEQHESSKYNENQYENGPLLFPNTFVTSRTSISSKSLIIKRPADVAHAQNSTRLFEEFDFLRLRTTSQILDILRDS